MGKLQTPGTEYRRFFKLTWIESPFHCQKKGGFRSRNIGIFRTFFGQNPLGRGGAFRNDVAYFETPYFYMNYSMIASSMFIIYLQ